MGWRDQIELAKMPPLLCARSVESRNQKKTAIPRNPTHTPLYVLDVGLAPDTSGVLLKDNRSGLLHTARPLERDRDRLNTWLTAEPPNTSNCTTAQLPPPPRPVPLHPRPYLSIQIRGIEARSVCAFGREPRTIVLISEDGSFLTARFSEPGECERISYARFLRGAGGGSDDEGDEDIARAKAERGGGGGGGGDGGAPGGGGGGALGGGMLNTLGQPSSSQTPTSLTRRPSGECGFVRCDQQ